MTDATAANPPMTPSAAAAPRAEDATPPRRKSWWRRLLRDKAAAIALSFLAIVCLAAIFAPLVAPYDPYETSRKMMLPPVWSDRGTWEHLLGTDGQGRDILSRVIYGSRLTLAIGLISVGIAGTIGSFLGLLGAFIPKLDALIMRTADVMLSFPAILLGLALVAMMGQGAVPIILALSISAVPDCARIARGIGMGIMKEEYIEAGRALGLRQSQLFTRYLLRNAVPSILIFISLRFGQMILLGASLSFLGLGVRPPMAELGTMAAQGRDFFLFSPHIAVIPSMLILMIVLAVNVAGDALRDVLDPRLQS